MLDNPFSMNFVIVDQLASHLADTCPDKKLQILRKSLLCFAKIGKINYSKIAKIWFVKFCLFNFKIVYLVQFSTHFNDPDLRI